MSVTTEKLSPEEKLEAVNRVLESQTFSRSDRLKNLLQFLCTAEMEGRCQDLNEYVIATDALGRPADFSPGEDSSVRSRAYELRRKLERFYADEAPDAELRVEIPKGSYLPKFRRVSKGEYKQSVSDPAQEPLPALPPPYAPSQTTRKTLIVLSTAAFVAGIILTLTALTLWNEKILRSVEVPVSWTPDLDAIWHPMIESKAPILVCFQTRLFFRVGPLNVRDWRINRVGAVEESAPLMSIKKFLNAPQIYENFNYADSGSVNAAFTLAKLLGTRKQNMLARRSADVTWDDLRANNVVIMGKPDADPTIAHWLARGKFQMVDGYIRNLEPRPGEPQEWKDDDGEIQRWTQKYGLITVLPGPSAGNWVMNLSGSGSEHPWAMAEYLTDPQQARELIRHIQLPSGKLPTAYQVVIRAEFKSQIPVKLSYVAHRVIAAP